MSVDDRLRTALRDAARGTALDVDHALRAVRSRVETVDLVERARPPARGARVVAALAACALLAGAIALPFALHSTREHTPTAASAFGRCGHTLSSGYRSTAVVRIAQDTADGTAPFHIAFAAPVPAALGLCDRVLGRSHLRSDDIRFTAETTSNLLSLVVSAPSSNDAAGLARAWGNAFVDARRADTADQIVEQQHQVTERVTSLHNELRRVDAQLAKLAPVTYGKVASVDGPISQRPGHPTNTVPPVPETGSVKLLNLAFERLSLISALRQVVTKYSALRITRVVPDPYAKVVSVSAPVRFPPHHDSNWLVVLSAVGLLGVGVMLGIGGILLRRQRT